VTIEVPAIGPHNIVDPSADAKAGYQTAGDNIVKSVQLL